MVVEGAIDNVKLSASPGYPYSKWGRTNRDILLNNRKNIRILVINRMDLLNTIDLRENKLSPIELVRLGFCDFVRLFVKNEPHLWTKIELNRYRLIHNVTIVDQVVERLLYSLQNQTEIAQWSGIPSCPGIGHDDANQRLFLENLPFEKGDIIMTTDMSAYDWTVKDWMMYAEASIRIKLIERCTDQYKRVIMNRVYCELNCAFVMPDGMVCSQMKSGKRCSGSYNTSAGNSRMRVLLAILAGGSSSKVKAMGDDCIELYNGKAQEVYQQLGMIAKVDGVSTESFEFCSHHHTLVDDKWSLGDPVNIGRTAYKLFNKRYHPLLHKQFLFDVRNSSKKEQFLTLVEILRNSGKWETSEVPDPDEDVNDLDQDNLM